MNYSSATEGKFIIFLNKSRAVPSEQEKGIIPGEVSILMLCKRRARHYSPAIGKGHSIIVL